MNPPLYVYQIRIDDRPYGFRVVAVVGPTEEFAKETARMNWNATFRGDKLTGVWDAEVRDSCLVQIGASASFEFEE
jgi:hypothetical protein